MTYKHNTFTQIRNKYMRIIQLFSRDKKASFKLLYKSIKYKKNDSTTVKILNTNLKAILAFHNEVLETTRQSSYTPESR